MQQGQFSYRCLTVSLAAAAGQSGQSPIVIQGAEPGSPITGVLLLSVPAGTVGNLHVGPGGDPMPLTQGLELDTDVCNPMSQGLFIDNPAQAGVSIQLIVTFGGASVASLGSM